MINKCIFGVIFAVVLVVCITAVNADTVEYSATVTGASNIVITELDLTFGNCNPGSNCTLISDSLQIQNLGNQAPSTGLNGTFITNISTSFGLNSSSNTIGGGNFTLNNTALSSANLTTEVVAVGVLSPSADFNISAGLAIPTGQTAGTYTGTILISWVA